MENFMTSFGKPFARAQMMMAAIAGIVASSGGNVALQQQQLAALGPYESRGKGQGGRNRVAAGAGMANHRAAMRARNVKRHRKACR